MNKSGGVLIWISAILFLLHTQSEANGNQTDNIITTDSTLTDQTGESVRIHQNTTVKTVESNTNIYIISSTATSVETVIPRISTTKSSSTQSENTGDSSGAGKRQSTADMLSIESNSSVITAGTVIETTSIDSASYRFIPSTPFIASNNETLQAVDCTPMSDSESLMTTDSVGTSSVKEFPTTSLQSGLYSSASSIYVSPSLSTMPSSSVKEFPTTSLQSGLYSSASSIYVSPSLSTMPSSSVKEFPTTSLQSGLYSSTSSIHVSPSLSTMPSSSVLHALNSESNSSNSTINQFINTSDAHIPSSNTTPSLSFTEKMSSASNIDSSSMDGLQTFVTSLQQTATHNYLSGIETSRSNQTMASDLPLSTSRTAAAVSFHSSANLTFETSTKTEITSSQTFTPSELLKTSGTPIIESPYSTSHLMSFITSMTRELSTSLTLMVESSHHMLTHSDIISDPQATINVSAFLSSDNIIAFTASEPAASPMTSISGDEYETKRTSGKESVDVFKDSLGLFVFFVVGAVLLILFMVGLSAYIHQTKMRNWNPGMAGQDAYTNMHEEETSLSQASTLLRRPASANLHSVNGNISAMSESSPETDNQNQVEESSSIIAKEDERVLRGQMNKAFEDGEADHCDVMAPVDELDYAPPRAFFPWIENAPDTKL